MIVEAADAALYDAELGGAKLELVPRFEVHRCAVQLYHHVLSHASVRGKDVLEIGCGRAGGASYVAANLHPRRYVGLDINKTAIAFDRRFYAEQKNLEFVAGDAHALPFGGDVFDLAVNVESSHHYRDLGAFLGEVHRVLKPGGTFLMACFPRKNELSPLRVDVESAVTIGERDVARVPPYRGAIFRFDP
jgi:ubiquinone/menaquinone biosynthesis C-methylase UbiE